MNEKSLALNAVLGTPLFKLEVPEVDVQALSLECIEPRALKSYRSLSRALGYKQGQLFPIKTAGAINGLLSENEDVAKEYLKTLDLLVGKGASTVIVTAHTDCAGDKAIYGVRPRDIDLPYQLEKIQLAYLKIQEYAVIKGYVLEIKCYLLDIIAGNLSVIPVTFAIATST